MSNRLLGQPPVKFWDRIRPSWWPSKIETNGGPPETKARVDFIPSGDGRVYDILSDASPNAARLTKAIAFATSAYAYAAIDYRASRLAEPPLGVIHDKPDGDEWLWDHELSLPLMEPSDDYDMGTLIYLTEVYWLTTGACLWIINRDRAGRPRVFTPFSADDFETESRDGLIYGVYRLTKIEENGRIIEGKEFEPEDVIHFRDPNPGSWRREVSRLDVALSGLDLGHQINRTVRNFARKVFAPGLGVSPHQDWDPDEQEFQQYVDRVKAWHMGPANAGEPLVTLGGTTVSRISAPLADLMPDEILDRIEASISAVFRVPPVVLGWLVGLRNSPWSQMSEARRMCYEDTIEPRWRAIEKPITRKLLTPEERARGLSVRFNTSDIRALFDDDMDRAKVAVLMRREWTVNERRRYTGQEPLPDERGDEIESGSNAPGTAFKALTGNEGEAKWHDAATIAWLTFDFSCKASEGQWEYGIHKALVAFRKGIIGLAREFLEEQKEIKPSSEKDFLEEVEAWLIETGKPLLQALVYPLVFSTSEKAVKQAAARVGVGFDLFEEGLLAYADRETDFLIEKMTETTGKAVAGAVQKGLEEGETIGQLTKRLEKLPEFSRKRAKLVARTETTRAWNGAQRSGMQHYQEVTMRVVEKSWLSSRDDRVRDEHDALDDGSWIPVEERFDNGLTEPGEPNCRCTLLYRIREPEETVEV